MHVTARQKPVTYVKEGGLIAAQQQRLSRRRRHHHGTHTYGNQNEDVIRHLRTAAAGAAYRPP